ncbi:antibiotic biosynthesis monooxygenase family enzyme [Luminiphilus syltensis NOR5-1B]|uniref:Antibiotic biosynthesis monooxygenase family enzyme n=1 Tax=Luminiphilus syltensis NOR5-1B TaxID=565045 RepID=B8KXM5_9GAMM|nr:antibiotic biosynthesis monooxygenase [Luminiphilus syltensis]EED35170.1 antibiotic biosynthesis monooxygenase family enzyme [Luminiphilus syltensis NOR5-1B]
MHYIFEVHIKPGYSAEEYAASWVEVSQHIQQAQGAQGTRLHRKIGDPNVLLAIATWESKSARDAMESSPPAIVNELIKRQIPYVDIRLIGEFDAPEWVVLPPEQA